MVTTAGREAQPTQAADVQVRRLLLKAGRLQIDLDAENCMGAIHLDGRRFPVTEMTLRIVAGRPLKAECQFWAEELAPREEPACPASSPTRS